MAGRKETLKPINTSIYDFPELIKGGYVYVDKTAQLYELAKPGADILYYLPRPRRFGKSLMISTLKALFQGRCELFRDLAIERTDWDWEKEVYPVLHLDMSKAEAALAQCREKRYADAYADDDRRIVYVGVNYDPAARTIGEVRTEAVRHPLISFA